MPVADVRRRFTRSWENFTATYQKLADAWWAYDTMDTPPKLLDSHA